MNLEKTKRYDAALTLADGYVALLSSMDRGVVSLKLNFKTATDSFENFVLTKIVYMMTQLIFDCIYSDKPDQFRFNHTYPDLIKFSLEGWDSGCYDLLFECIESVFFNMRQLVYFESHNEVSRDQLIQELADGIIASHSIP